MVPTSVRGMPARALPRFLRRGLLTPSVAALALAAAITGTGSAVAQEAPSNWREVKCVRYASAWSEALKRKGTQGLGREFVEGHDAFIASGCTAGVAVCPRSAEELDMANIMVLATLNAGIASTFPPFSCRK
jgi:hypothetical protein